MSKSYEWHRHNHSKILASYAGLSAEQRGVAYTLLDLIYDRQGPIIEHEKVLAARMQMGKVKFCRIRDELISLGKFFMTEGGHLMNQYAEKELAAVSEISEIRAKSGKKGGENSGNQRRKANKNNETGEAKSKQSRSRDKERETIPPYGENSPLPPDGALALEGLRAACGTDTQITELGRLTASIEGWQDGAFLVTSGFVRNRFNDSLRGPLAEAKVKLLVEKTRPPEPPALRQRPVLVPITGGRSMEAAGETA